MTGSTFVRNDYLYIKLNYKDPETGKWKSKQIATHKKAAGNKRSVAAEIPEYIKKYEYLEKSVARSGVDPKIGFSEYLRHWLKLKRKGSCCDVTKERIEIYINRIIRYFEPYHFKVIEITPYIVNAYLQDMLSHGKTNQKTGASEPLSVRTVRGYKGILNAVFVQARIDGIRIDNPVDGIVISGKKNREFSEEMLFLTREEIADFLNFLKKNYPRLVPFAFFASYYGLRRSELLGLKWNAIDFDKHTISIENTVTRAKHVHEQAATKTSASRRTLTLIPLAEKCLKNILLEKKENKEFFGNEYVENEHIFTWEDGRSYDPNYISRTFKKATKKYGRPEISLHKLRHSCVSLLAEMGWDVKKIQYWVGHSDFTTTVNIYMHFNKQRLNHAADDLAEITNDCSDII